MRVVDTKHTPLIIGQPWFRQVDDEILGRDADGEVFVIAQVNPLAEMPGEVTDNHARLLTAAPELLAALQTIVNSDMAMREEDEGNTSSELTAARAAIAKATEELPGLGLK